ncbi:MAG: hypothetical protein NT029_16630 [Armatimonadetes bacterium]|nr:hypothetical protein [Armatimonadota bacterium]
MSSLVRMCLACILAVVAWAASMPVMATVPCCGVSAEQDVPSSGYDRVTYWAAPTTSWTVIGRFWQGDYVPSGVNDTAGTPVDTGVASGAAAMDIDHQVSTNFNAQQYIESLYAQGGKDYYYAYRMRNMKTTTVVVIEWTELLIRLW